MSNLTYTPPLCRLYQVSAQKVICQSGPNTVPIDYDPEEIELT